MKKLLNRTTIVMICVWVLSISVSAAKMLIPVGQGKLSKGVYQGCFRKTTGD